MKVFISGSISIKKLPTKIKESILKIIDKNLEILVGDASGVDSLVQDFAKEKGYFNVTIYTIEEKPRYQADNRFKIIKANVSPEVKKGRERQQEKDKKMTLDSNYSLVIWDGKSKGSYANIIRAIDNNKKVKVYLTQINDFIPQNKINKEEIKFIYSENNGYTATEVVNYLKEQGIDKFKRPQQLNKFLLDNLVIKKENKIYLPTEKYKDLFIIEKFRGKVKGIKFRNEFIEWIENRLKPKSSYKQLSLTF
jgi:hypothetical protein